ncbi:MAG TPA: hypothetical protein VI844_01050 [Coxiellaceae bacterium]|nr:hypothetical protein [Coxiellaceae bacterium]
MRRYYYNPLIEIYNDPNVKKYSRDDKCLWNPKDCLCIVDDYLSRNNNVSAQPIGVEIAMPLFTPIVPVSQTSSFLELLSLLRRLKKILDNTTAESRYTFGESLEELQEIASMLSISLVYAMYYAFSKNHASCDCRDCRDDCRFIKGLAVNCCRLYRKFQQPETHGMDPLDQEMIEIDSPRASSSTLSP